MEQIEAVFMSIAADFLVILGWAWPLMLLMVGMLVVFVLVMRVVDRGRMF